MFLSLSINSLTLYSPLVCIKPTDSATHNQANSSTTNLNHELVNFIAQTRQNYFEICFLSLRLKKITTPARV